MNTSKSDKSKQFSILINDELKSSIDDENDDEDDSIDEKPLLDRKEKNGKKKQMKKGGYYELSKQERENVNELFESSNSKIVNAVDYDDELEESDDEDYKDEETNEQTQLTRPKKGRHTDKKSIRKKLFGSSSKSGSNSGPNLSKQNSTDDELNLGKIKILIPRKKNKSKLIRYKIRKFLRNFVSLCFLLTALVVVFILLYFKRQYLNQFVNEHLSNSPSSSVKRTLDQQSKHCDMLIVNNLWNASLPQLVVGDEIRLIDVNKDDDLDIVLPFETSIDQFKYNSILCQIYFNQTDPNDQNFDGCGGGLLLLDGKTGEEVWRAYTRHRLNSVNCFLDLDGDGIDDCFAVGQRAQFYAISGGSGRRIWKIDTEQQGEPFQPNAAFHAPLLIKDVDEDGINDILVMHGGDYQRKSKSASARMICLSSRTGKIIRWAHVPDGQDSYMPPVLFYRNEKNDPDTAEIVYGTGSPTSPGSLYSINLDEFLRKNTLKESIKIYKDCCKGILTPPILIDLNKDRVQDIVIAFNSTVAAFNGRTFVELWHRKFPTNTEFYVPPSVGYFDDDDVADFIVQYELSDGFPNSYYSEVQVLDGRNGKPMLKDSLKMLTGAKSSPISISMNSQLSKSTNTSDQTIDSFDLFLFWQTTCDKQEEELSKLSNNEQFNQLKFKLKFNSINELRKSNLCKLRFNKNSVHRLNSISYGNIMTTIYDSNERAAKELEQNRFNSTKTVSDYLSKDPSRVYDYLKNFDQESGYSDDDGGDLKDLLSNKRDQNDQYEPTSFNDANNGFYLPNINDKPDYSFKQQSNDFSPFSFNNKGSFSLPSQQQPNFNLPNLGSNDLASLLLNQYQQQQQQPKVPPPFSNQEFDLSKNNRNRFVKKKSSPFDDRPTLEEFFQRRRSKRSAHDDTKFIHEIYSTATLAPSKIENGIDLIFATNWVPENTNIKLIKKSEYDECIRTAKQNKDGRLYSKGNMLDEYMSLCLSQLNKNDESKKGIKDKMFERQIGSSMIYRNSLKCKNSDFKMKKYKYQIWPTYMGIKGNGMANI